MTKINLLDNKRKELVKRQQQATKVNKLGFAVFAISLLLFMGTLIWRFRLSSELNEVKDDTLAKKKQLESLETVRIESLITAEKLDIIGNILAGREILGKKLELFFRLVGNEDMVLREVGFGDSDNRDELEFGGSSASLASFIDFTVFLEDLSSEGGLKMISLDSANRSDDKIYRFFYKLKLAQEAL